MLLAGFELFAFTDRRGFSMRGSIGGIAILLLLEGMSTFEFSQYSYMWWHNDRGTPSEARTLEHVVDYMKSRGVSHAYSMHALLQWQISFYSRESVIARWKVTDDRYPRYITQVDGALSQGQPIALVGYVGYTSGVENFIPDRRAVVEFDGKYFVLVGAERELLRTLGFRFSN